MVSTHYVDGPAYVFGVCASVLANDVGEINGVCVCTFGITEFASLVLFVGDIDGGDRRTCIASVSGPSAGFRPEFDHYTGSRSTEGVLYDIVVVV